MKSWKLPVLMPGYGGCLNCGPRLARLHLSTSLDVGFGFVVLTCDGKDVRMFMSRRQRPYPSYYFKFEQSVRKTARWAERKAAKQPNRDWRLVFRTPLSDRTYQRQGRKSWVLVVQGRGFA